MDTKRYKNDTEMLMGQFPKAYPQEYIDRVWIIWERLPYHSWQKVINGILKSGIPRCLATEGMKIARSLGIVFSQQIKAKERDPDQDWLDSL
jgi:hypothetical protein